VAGFADIKLRARREIHAAFSVAAEYEDSTTEPTPLAVRWHDKFTVPTGDIGGGEYSRQFENIDQIIFDAEELAEKGVTPRRGGTVTLLDTSHVLTLDAREPSDGPIKIVWTVTRP
jgi:hypothetical protein